MVNKSMPLQHTENSWLMFTSKDDILFRKGKKAFYLGEHHGTEFCHKIGQPAKCTREGEEVFRLVEHKSAMWNFLKVFYLKLWISLYCICIICQIIEPFEGQTPDHVILYHQPEHEEIFYKKSSLNSLIFKYKGLLIINN